MRIRKKPIHFTLCAILAMLATDQPRRQVPAFWETALAAEQLGRFVIQEEGDITLKFVAARLGTGNLELVPVPFYHSQGSGTRSIQEIAHRYSLETKQTVMAAVNGGFFDTATGLPIGFLMRDGQMDFFNMPQGFQRSMVGFTSPGTSGSGAHVWISSPQQMPKAWLDVMAVGQGQPARSGSVAVHHVNVRAGKNALALFSSSYGERMRIPPDAVYLTADPEPHQPGTYRVSDIRQTGYVHIPRNGLVVALHGSSRSVARLFPWGTLIHPRWTLPVEWTDHAVTHGLLAGPRLLQEGKLQVTAKVERLDQLRSRDRVALAVKANGDALLVWAHRNSRGNLSYEQLAEILEKMGAVEAIALDGGKSRGIFAQAGEAYADERYFEGGRPVANAVVLAVKPARHS